MKMFLINERLLGAIIDNLMSQKAKDVLGIIRAIEHEVKEHNPKDIPVDDEAIVKHDEVLAGHKDGHKNGNEDSK